MSTAKNSIASFGITPSSGALTLAATAGAGTFPLSIAIDPLGQFVYVANANSANVSVYFRELDHRRADPGRRLTLRGGSRRTLDRHRLTAARGRRADYVNVKPEKGHGTFTG